MGKEKFLKPIPRFIVFEGVEGSGKTTQAKLLTSYLRKKGYLVVRVKDPGTTKIGEKIRRILKNDEPSEVTELLLFLAARRQLVDEVIRPALSYGRIVIADRFTHSTFAYQGAGRGLMNETLNILCWIASGGIEPDLVFILDLPPEEGLARKKGKDRFELEDISFHRRVREYYLELAKSDDEKFVLLDATQDPFEIHEQVVQRIESWAERRQGKIV